MGGALSGGCVVYLLGQVVDFGGLAGCGRIPDGGAAQVGEEGFEGGALFALYLVGVSVQLPQPILDLDPFTHLPKLPGGPFQIAPVLWLLLIAAALLTAGLAGLRHRDLR